MATLIKISKLTPEFIQGKLFSFHNSAHKLHLDTKSFAQHKALDSLYNDLAGFKDEVSEKLMGYMGGKRIGKITLDEVPTYSEGAANKLAEEIKNFAKDLEEWASENEYSDIENIAQGLSGVAVKTIYLLTLT